MEAHSWNGRPLKISAPKRWAPPWDGYILQMGAHSTLGMGAHLRSVPPWDARLYGTDTYCRWAPTPILGNGLPSPQWDGRLYGTNKYCRWAPTPILEWTPIEDQRPHGMGAFMRRINTTPCVSDPLKRPRWRPRWVKTAPRSSPPDKNCSPVPGDLLAASPLRIVSSPL